MSTRNLLYHNVNVLYNSSTLDVEKDNLAALIYHYGIFGLITCVNIPGNLLVIITFLRHAVLRKPANLFIVGLATSDLCQAFVFPVYTVSHIKNAYIQKDLGSWSFCRGILIALQMSQICSSFHLLAITVTRYFAIVKPLQYRVYFTTKVAVAGVLGIWVGSLVTSFSIFYPEKPDTFKHECMYEKLYGLKRISLSFAISLVIPLFIMFGLYFKIVRVARKHVKGRTNDINCSVRNTGKEWKATVMVAFLLGVFTIAWLPLFVYFYVDYFCNGCISSPFVRATVRIVLYTNSAVNVFIYSLRLDAFRNAVKKDLDDFWTNSKRGNCRDSVDIRRTSSISFIESFKTRWRSIY